MSRQSAPDEQVPAAAEAVASLATGELAVGVTMVLGGCVLALWLRRSGVLTPGYLRGTPRRLAALGWGDLAVVLGLFLVGQIFAGLALREASERLGPGDPRLAGASVLILQTAGVGLPSLWVLGAAGRMRDGLRRLGFFLRPRHLVLALKTLPIAWLLSTAVLLVAAAVAWLGAWPTPTVQHVLLEAIQADGRWVTLLPIVVGAVVIAPVTEEVLNRGLVQTLLRRLFGRRSPWLAVVVASAAFAALHVSAVPPQALPGLFVLGVVFGALYERTGSLVPGILVHAAFNGLNIALVAAGVAG